MTSLMIGLCRREGETVQMELAVSGWWVMRTGLQVFCKFGQSIVNIVSMYAQPPNLRQLPRQLTVHPHHIIEYKFLSCGSKSLHAA
jgi:hypothetical protein